MDDQETRRMQVKVLYSFNNNPTVFLSRSSSEVNVKIAQIPTGEEVLTLGAFDLKNCVEQIIKSSPENFKLQQEDYVVYYKDVTEQPDEPFVSNGNLSNLVDSEKSYLVPGRICQNLSTSYLFGDKSNGSALTLEIRLKLHVTEKSEQYELAEPAYESETTYEVAEKTYERSSRPHKSSVSKSSAAKATSTLAKATRTKSLPIFTNVPSQTMFNIMNHDKQNASKYDKSVQDRFKLAPFFMEKIIDKPARRKRKTIPLSTAYPAVRTRSMINVSSPINEELSEEYDEDIIEEYPSSKFQSLPDLEDLDSKNSHLIPVLKATNHALICVNENCATLETINCWRYFEVELTVKVPNLKHLEFNPKNYDSMFGPLCNACFLFLRNKGFMRPDAVVKKYQQQQRYKRGREDETKEEYKESLYSVATKKANQFASSPFLRIASSPGKTSSPGKFLTPSHTPSTINQVIQNQQYQYQDRDLNDFMNQINNFGGPLTDIDIPGDTPPMIATKANTRVINLYEDGVDEDKENCPPMDPELDEFETMIVKSFHAGSNRSSPQQTEWMNNLFEPSKKDTKTPTDGIDFKRSPGETSSPTPTETPTDGLDLKKTSAFKKPDYKKQSSDGLEFKPTAVNMPSSPNQVMEFLDTEEFNELMKTPKRMDFTDSSPGAKVASRNDTLMTWENKKGGSTPNSDFYEDVKKVSQ